MLKRRLLLSFTLVLALLAVAVVVAIGLDGDNPIQAQGQEQTAVISVTPGSAIVDSRGMTSAHNTTVTLTVLRYGEEGPGFVPAYHLIKPIPVSGNLITTAGISSLPGQKMVSIATVHLPQRSVGAVCPQGSTKTMHLNLNTRASGGQVAIPAELVCSSCKGGVVVVGNSFVRLIRTNGVSPDDNMSSGARTWLSQQSLPVY